MLAPFVTTVISEAFDQPEPPFTTVIVLMTLSCALDEYDCSVFCELAIVNDAFDRWMIDKNLDIFRQYKVIDALNTCLDNCIESGDDYPDMYPDLTDSDGILWNMHYISDRWFTSGRIRFILRVIGE